jgi:hypothetical protein
MRTLPFVSQGSPHLIEDQGACSAKAYQTQFPVSSINYSEMIIAPEDGFRAAGWLGLPARCTPGTP